MTVTATYSDLTRSFEAQDIESATFHHVEHVQVAYGLIDKYDFIDAASIFAKGIRLLAHKAGAPQKFNLTITYAFMSVIAERMASSAHGDYDDFIAQNPDLLSKTVLENWYAPERLQSETARRVFLMPTPERDCSANTG